ATHAAGLHLRRAALLSDLAISAPVPGVAWTSATGDAKREYRSTQRAGTPKTALLAGAELLLERLDVFLVHVDRLPQPRDALAVFLDVRAFLGQRRRCTIRVCDARFGQELFLGRELVAQDLPSYVVAHFLRRGVDLGEAGRRGCRGRALARARIRRVCYRRANNVEVRFR